MDRFKQPLEPTINLGSKKLDNARWATKRIANPSPGKKEKRKRNKKKKKKKRLIRRKASILEITNKQRVCGRENGK